MNLNRINLATVKNLTPAEPGKKVQSEMVESLNEILALEFGLFSKSLNYHWNVKGPHFSQYHELFEKQYYRVLKNIDDTAERIIMLGGEPRGELNQIVETLGLKDSTYFKPDSELMINDLLRDHMFIQKKIKNLIETQKDTSMDLGTEDFLVEILKEHENASWVLQSHIQ